MAASSAQAYRGAAPEDRSACHRRWQPLLGEMKTGKRDFSDYHGSDGSQRGSRKMVLATWVMCQASCWELRLCGGDILSVDTILREEGPRQVPGITDFISTWNNSSGSYGKHLLNVHHIPGNMLNILSGSSLLTLEITLQGRWVPWQSTVYSLGKRAAR